MSSASAIANISATDAAVERDEDGMGGGRLPKAAVARGAVSSGSNELPASGASRRDLFLSRPNRGSIRNLNSFAVVNEPSTFGFSGIDHMETVIEGVEERERRIEEGGGGPTRSAELRGKKKGCCTNFWRITGQFPLTFVMAGVIIGMSLGIGLSFWTPADPSVKSTAILWIGLLGQLFIRSLKCIILPLVFVSIAVSVMDMVSSLFRFFVLFSVQYALLCILNFFSLHRMVSTFIFMCVACFGQHRIDCGHHHRALCSHHDRCRTNRRFCQRVVLIFVYLERRCGWKRCPSSEDRVLS